MSLADALLLIEEKRVLYHGTSTHFLRRILKHGLIPDPRDRIDDKGQGSLMSYPGAYLTASAQTYAERAVKKFGGNQLYVIAQVETRTATFDEDEIPPMLPHVGKLRAAAVIDWMNDLRVVMGDQQLRPEVEKRLRGIATEWYSAELEYDADSDYPEPQNLTRVRKARDKAYKALKSIFYKANLDIPSRRSSITGVSNVRVPEPINFRGSNRILTIIELVPEQQRGNRILRNVRVFHYGRGKANIPLPTA